MSFGFKSIGENGTIQIDENYPSISLLGKGTFTPTTPYGLRARVGTITLSGDMPLLAIRATPQTGVGRKGATVIGISRSGQNWTFTILVFNDYATKDWSIQYFHYARPPNTLSGFGLVVKDSTGLVTYNSNYPAMNLSAGGTRAFVAMSLVNYSENPIWDTEEQREVISYGYSTTVYWVDGANVVTYVADIETGEALSPPSLGYENFGYDQGFLSINVTNQ